MVRGRRRAASAGRLGLLLTTAACLTTGLAVKAQAADHLPLPIVKPVIGCDQLAKVQLGKIDGSAVTIKSASVLQTPKGSYCQVVGAFEPAAEFEVDLPIEHWTQRLEQNASTGAHLGVSSASDLALNGELAVAVNDRGGRAGRGDWTLDPARRISWAYEANHQTAVLSKALIKAFYDQGPRFSYFMGCSGGGRESMIEAQRWPDDFDGVSAGAAAMMLNISNGGFYHSWEFHVNKRPDGSPILVKDRLGVLHDAVVAHCAAVSGVIDGMLQVPTACKFDPSWVQCGSAGVDPAKCLTPEETAVAVKLYDGASDDGRYFEMKGFPLGSETHWELSTPGKDSDAQNKPGRSLQYLLPLPEANQPIPTLDAAFQFNQAWFDKLGVLAPLYNAGDTDLRPFEQHGGKLILWHGAADLQVQQDIAIVYYEGVQKLLGPKTTDGFMRLFTLPGVGHCGGGDGPDQIDLFKALTAWTELNQAPDMIIAGKLAPKARGAGGGEPREGFGPPYQPAPRTDFLYTRPIYPFPYIAKYSGKGDPTDAASYVRVQSKVKMPEVIDSEAMALIGPDNVKKYRVENGNTVPQ
ncbi:MAG TPA: tannase/feruloyl esterase family alpha/beta hydrolase [Caulobacteraceae bacterium]|nr:tannase/feruloyl esterase family alpha/beta hydrolase [Caulobacteraceae bacterium]